MNIQCKWAENKRVMDVLACGKFIGAVCMVEDEPCLTLFSGEGGYSHPSLTFSEIEHIMDNWYNLPKN